MFVNKINGVTNLGFKGYQHVKNDVGETVLKFNYPYDYKNEDCEIHIYKATPTANYNYKLSDSPIYKFALKPEGVEVNLQTVTNLGKEDAFAYKVVRKNKQTGEVIETADTGVKIKPQENGEYVFRNSDGRRYQDVFKKDAEGNNTSEKLFSYETIDYADSVSNYTHTLVTRKGTTPMTQGAGYLIAPDSFMPGAKYKGFDDPNTGEIYYDKEYQKKMEGVVKNFSNIYGGNLAGLQRMIPYLKQNGTKVLFTNPIANGAKGWSLGYWNKNNMQVSPNIGNTENFASFFRDLYKNGIKYVYDGTFTSEGLEGIHFQYALRWAHQKPQSYYWFKMSALKDSTLGLGVVPQNKENLRHRIINAPYNYELQSDGTYKAVENPDYNSKKETLVQIYDASQASDEQLNKLDKAIINYEKLTKGNVLDIIDHDDTVINFVMQINPKEYANRIKVINELNKKFGKNIKLDTPDGTIMACEFSNFKFDKKTEGGFVTWDANTDLAKMNYHISGYDEKILQAIPNLSQRDYEKQMIERGAREAQDMAIQSGKYWTGKVKDIQTMYIAQTIGKAKTTQAIENLIKDGKLPQEASISNEVLNNILNGTYMLAPKGIDNKDDITVRALMRMPLDALELGENTVGVLSTSYFSNRATTDETIGVSRFDLMKQNNPHLVEPYTKTYKKVNSLFNNELKDFADAIIAKVNDKSDEKLLDANGDYTEYGEYVMELVGQDIAKYAWLKSLGGDSFKVKTLQSGEITYDYETLKEGTTLKALNINANTPEDEAEQLEKKIRKGLKKLSDTDISYVTDSIAKRIANTDTSSFRLAEAITDRSSLGMNWRLDAAKDMMDMDAIRNEDDAFDDGFDNVMAFWKKFVQTVKSEDPNSYIVAEITDIPDLMRDTYGTDSCPYNGETNIGQKFNGEPDAFAKFFNETGVTSEAGYSYFFTNLLQVFSQAFDTGNGASMTHDSFKPRLELLLQTRSADYLRNLWTFMDCHDKPRMIHGLALDMELFHNSGNVHNNRLKTLQVLTGAKSIEDIPINIRLNIDNDDYMRTASTRAAAMSRLLLDVFNQDIKSMLSEDDLKNINDAILDLTNGNYLGVGKNINYQTLAIEELTSLEKAFETILKMAENHGLKLSDTERKQLIQDVVKKANTLDLSNYRVLGDLDWDKGISDDVKHFNEAAASDLLGTSGDHKSYSLLSIQLARLLRDAYKESQKMPNAEAAIKSALTDFVEKYNRETVRKKTTELPRFEDPSMSRRKNGYAARDIKVAIKMALKQAEYKTGKTIPNKEAVIDSAFKAATEPAVVKAAMITEFFKGLPGIPTTYAGDELGATGYEEKAKNIYLQNRNALPWSDLDEDSIIGNYRKSIMGAINGALADRSNPTLHSLNDGTPYMMDVMVDGRNRDDVQKRIAEINKELQTNPANKDALEKERRQLTKELAKIACMMQSANGDMTVTVFNAGNINHDSRHDYFKDLENDYGIKTEADRKKFFAENNIESINPNNRYVPIQPKSELDCILIGAGIAIPAGTIFANANAKDKAEYVVKQIGNKFGIFRKDGGKIVMDGITAKNGVMILKKIKNIAFRGKNPSSQYNIVSNPYKHNEVPVETGKKLSIISK